MSTREVWRRVGIWTVVAALLTAAIWLAVLDQPIMLLETTGLIVVGAFVLTVRRGNVIGLVCLLVPTTIVVDQALGVEDAAALTPAWIETVGDTLNAISVLLLPLGVLIFPSGRVRTRVGAVLLRLTVALAAGTAVIHLISPVPLFYSGRPNPWGLAAVSPLYGSGDEWLTALHFQWPAAILLTIAALGEFTARWARSDGLERLQFRWFAFGAAIMLVAASIFAATGFAEWALIVWALSINALPLVIGIAITRHGLYSIGRVVSRTVSYAIVTLFAVGVYAGLVTGLTALIPNLPSVGVALATLAAAALFLPLLRLVQRRLDRRFDRERYNSIQVVDAFGEHLRTDADPAAAGGELVQAVEQTLQPTTVGLWTSGVSR